MTPLRLCSDRIRFRVLSGTFNKVIIAKNIPEYHLQGHTKSMEFTPGSGEQARDALLIDSDV